ncbi:hypothetical protein L2E82_10486 [Cichorium intybus]|uniref:Uncharacterized protein n=1 Tax=Cichorium intybus TaxID=13427 RepID=A0ACB9GBP6_CICIN|nr:hypothetical protein L2E82_10486 [Cichorium intybus]
MQRCTICNGSGEPHESGTGITKKESGEPHESGTGITKKETGEPHERKRKASERLTLLALSKKVVPKDASGCSEDNPVTL